MDGASRSSLTLFHNAMIVTMDSKCRVFRDGGLVVEDDRIKAIGHSADIVNCFSAASDVIIDLHGQILLPGGIAQT